MYCDTRFRRRGTMLHAAASYSCEGASYYVALEGACFVPHHWAAPSGAHDARVPRAASTIPRPLVREAVDARAHASAAEEFEGEDGEDEAERVPAPFPQCTTRAPRLEAGVEPQPAASNRDRSVWSGCTGLEHAELLVADATNYILFYGPT